MNINKRARILVGAVALAGSVAFAGNAFTAGGFVADSATKDIVGGNDSITVEGASLSTVSYDVDEANNLITGVNLTFGAGANGKDVTIAFTGGADQGTFTCTDISSNASTCSASEGNEASNDVSGLAITVGDLD